MFNEPILTIEQAKAYFRAMECSSYHMWREFPQRYAEYKKLNISQQTEMDWLCERFDEIYASLMENTTTDPLWITYSQMVDLFENLTMEAGLIKIMEVTQHIREQVPLRDRVIVAEKINGTRAREARSGLIYAAYDLRNLAAARAFVELSLHFSIYSAQENRGLERCQEAAELCRAIQLELGL